MARNKVRELDLKELCHDMRPPSDDEFPRTLDGTALDTKDKLLAYLMEINQRREGARVD